MQPSPELEAILRRYLAARREADYERVRNLYSTSEHFRAIGTRKDDWYDAAAWEETIQEDWDAYEIVDEDLLRLEAFENGDTGWVAMETERQEATGHRFVYRLTIVFVLEAGSWRVIQSHFSAAVEDEVLYGTELTRTLSDLVDSIDTPVTDAASRTGTVVFTDIVGSTSLSESMGDTAWSMTVGRHFDELRTTVDSHDGRTIKTLGDGAMFVFDAAASALRAATAIRTATATGDLPVRIGVHTGDLIAGDGDVLGATVAKAARVTSAADGGQVLVSATTAGMANPTEFSFGQPISLELKGLACTHVLHELR